METRSDIAGPVIAAADARWVGFNYDYLGRRVEKIVRAGWNGSTYATVISDTRYLYSGWNLIAEYAVGASLTQLRNYTWGLDLSGTLAGDGGVGGLLMCQDGSTQYVYAYDGNGNVSAVLNRSGGTSVAEYEYSPFGETIRGTSAYAAVNPFRFSTKYTDNETGLLWYGFRYYSPTTGRFLGRDPSEEKGGLHLYAFCLNNAITGWDVLGLDRNAAPMWQLPDGTSVWEDIDNPADAQLNSFIAMSNSIASTAQVPTDSSGYMQTYTSFDSGVNFWTNGGTGATNSNTTTAWGGTNGDTTTTSSDTDANARQTVDQNDNAPGMTATDGNGSSAPTTTLDPNAQINPPTSGVIVDPSVANLVGSGHITIDDLSPGTGNVTIDYFAPNSGLDLSSIGKGPLLASNSDGMFTDGSIPFVTKGGEASSAGMGGVINTDFGYATVNYWAPMDGNKGHLWITLSNGTYISNWPVGNNMHVFDLGQNRTPTFNWDKADEGFVPQRISVSAVNVTAMTSWWNASKGSFNGLFFNCSTVTNMALNAGGLYVPSQLIESPTSTFNNILNATGPNPPKPPQTQMPTAPNGPW